MMEETFRLDLNQSWQAIDIKNGPLSPTIR
jgi:hypothetical protein